MLVALGASADELPRLVHDFPGVNLKSSSPVVWTTEGNTTWFVAEPEPRKPELFRTDGTPEGTVQLTSGKGSPHAYWKGPFVGTINGKLIYGGNDEYPGGLYALDMQGGTPVLIGDVKPEDLTNGVVRDGWLYFVARVWIRNEWRLWRTNGTAAGTQPLDVIQDWTRGIPLYRVDDAIFFFGTTARGTGLHSTLGTLESTKLLRAFDRYTMATQLTSLTRVVGNRLLFWFFPSPSELWSSDGTPEGTRLLANTQAFHPLAVIGNRQLFDGPGRTIWSTDGTPEGTKDLGILSGADLFTLYAGAAIGNRLFFFAERFQGTTLYVTEGTPETTRVVLFMPRRNQPGGGFVLGNHYYFAHNDGVHGFELWKTDGGPPVMVTDLNPGPQSAIIGNPVAEVRPDGTALFAAMHRDSGVEPWITDGTAAGTRLVANLAAEDFVSFSASPYGLRAVGDRVFFTAAMSGGGYAVGVTDGVRTSATPFAQGEISGWYAASNGRYFYSNGTDLYASDGTTAMTRIARGTLPAAVPGGVVFQRRAVNGGSDLGSEILFTDGTEAGTHYLRNATPVPSHYFTYTAGDRVWFDERKSFWYADGDRLTEVVVPEPRIGYLAAVQRAGAVYYLLEVNEMQGRYGVRLWRSDGTSAGTRLVTARNAGQYPSFLGATERLVFVSIDGQLYSSDGTKMFELPVSQGCRSQGVLGDELVFLSVEYQKRWTVWRTDGTAAGTAKLYTVENKWAECSETVAHANRVYFRAEDDLHGSELWVTDGTAFGTRMLADIEPGPDSSYPMEFTPAGDTLFFTAKTSIGRELWAVGDGSNANPKRRRPTRTR